jgi:hypothetical protein
MAVLNSLVTWRSLVVAASILIILLSRLPYVEVPVEQLNAKDTAKDDIWYQKWEVGGSMRESIEHSVDPLFVAHLLNFPRPSKMASGQADEQDLYPTLLVPLAGASMACEFATFRFNVVCVDSIQNAVDAFWNLSGLAHTKVDIDGLMVYEGESPVENAGRLVYLHQDMFYLTGRDLESINLPSTVDAIWDRRSLEALMPVSRKAYAAKLTSLSRPGTVMLLVVHDREIIPGGPPYPLYQQDVENLYQESWHIDLLHADATTGEVVYKLVLQTD